MSNDHLGIFIQLSNAIPIPALIVVTMALVRNRIRP